MTEPRIIIVGARGHGRVVANALLVAGATVVGFADADPMLVGTSVLGLPVLGDDEALAGIDRRNHLLANGVGGTGVKPPTARRAVAQRLLAEGWRFAQVCHPTATIAATAHLGEGAQVLAGAIVQPGAAIGAQAIINTGAVVEHDCKVGAYAHVSIGAILCGDVMIGKECHIGAGAVVIQGISLGAGVVVGAGAAVVRSHESPGLLLGVPARLSTI